MKLFTLAALALAFTAQLALADTGGEAAKAKADTQQAWTNTKKLVKKEGRAASDEACPMVNGKVECAAKKLKHKAQNAADTVKN